MTIPFFNESENDPQINFNTSEVVARLNSLPETDLKKTCNGFFDNFKATQEEIANEDIEIGFDQFCDQHDHQVSKERQQARKDVLSEAQQCGPGTQVLGAVSQVIDSTSEGFHSNLHEVEPRMEQLQPFFETLSICLNEDNLCYLHYFISPSLIDVKRCKESIKCKRKILEEFYIQHAQGEIMFDQVFLHFIGGKAC